MRYASDVATEKSIDTAIEICIAHKDSLEVTISFVKEKFANVTNDYLASRFETLSAATSK